MYNFLLDSLPEDYEGYLLRTDYRVGIQISQALELEEDYISSILVCRQSHSDDAASIAHMVMME